MGKVNEMLNVEGAGIVPAKGSELAENGVSLRFAMNYRLNKPDKVNGPQPEVDLPSAKDKPDGSGPDSCWLGLSLRYAKHLPTSSEKIPCKKIVALGAGMVDSIKLFIYKDRRKI